MKAKAKYVRISPRKARLVADEVRGKSYPEAVSLLQFTNKRAAKIIADGQGRSLEEALENVGISPQCGFASVAVGAEGMTEEKMFAKLKLVNDVAKEIWPGKA